LLSVFVDDAELLLSRAAAFEDLESDARWDIVMQLHNRADRDSFEAALAFARSASEAERMTGIDVLGQIGYAAGRPYLEETLLVLIAATVDDRSDAVACSAIFALGHLHDPRALAAVVRHARHPSPEVRFAVAAALPSVANEPPSDEAIATLIELSADTDTDVRDWSAFGLGSLLEADTQQVRDALAARLTDHDEDTATEALVGPARRQDRRALPVLLACLDGAPGDLIIEAAAALANPAALPGLQRLRDVGLYADDSKPTLLDRAITACEQRRPYID
jgi:HEAT repeat protein